jgi:CDP-glycerol glycerophosphotransferase
MASGGLWSVLRRSSVAASHWLLSLWPTRSARACVFGWPDYEENSLVAAASLASDGGFNVTLLVDDPVAARRYLGMIDASEPAVDLVRKNSLRGLVRASRSRVLVFTHGLYGAPDLTARKLVINLWHGFGPKATANATFARRIPFGVMTCNTPVWAGPTARALGAPHARLVRTGNPRQAFLEKPGSPAALERLGLGDAPFVLWMPTHRSANGISGPVWRDSVALSGRAFHGESADAVTGLARMAQEAGVPLVVKPHPLDADDYARSGLRVITTKEILDSGMTLYQFIGSSAAMISDYSSVWVEYLHIDRPLALYCPDIAEYVQGRGLNPPYLTDIGGGLLVELTEDLRPFLEAVKRGSDWRPDARESLRAALDLAAPNSHVSSVASVVLNELGERGATR